MSKYIKIYGERNTNTNYLSRLIQLNLDAQELPGVVPSSIMKLQKIFPGKEMVRDLFFVLTYRYNLGWKHTCVKSYESIKDYRIVKSSKSDLYFITLTKNPYSWLISLYRRPYHQHHSLHTSFLSFLQKPWETVGRDNCNRTLENPIALWNIKNRSYLKLKQNYTLNIRTEDLIEKPEVVISKITDKFSIDRLTTQFANYNESTKDKNKNYQYYRDYYSEERWRDELSQGAIDLINTFVDKDLMRRYTYKVL